MVHATCEEWKRGIAEIRAAQAAQTRQARQSLSHQLWPPEMITKVADDLEGFLSSEDGHVAMEVLRTVGEWVHLTYSRSVEPREEYVLTGHGLKLVVGERDQLKRRLHPPGQRPVFKLESARPVDVVMAAAFDPEASSPREFVSDIISAVDEAAKSQRPPEHHAF